MVSVMAAVPDGDLDRDLDVGAMVSATMMSVMVSAMAEISGQSFIPAISGQREIWRGWD